MAQVRENYSSLQHSTPEDVGGSPGLAHYWGIAKKRWLYFLVPFVVIVSGGIALVANQQPIYLSQGKILVEAQEIPSDLVRSTVPATAKERIQVIQQRLMTSDKLLGVMNKFDLFSAHRQWMSETQLLDLMKERTQFGQVDLNSPTVFDPNNNNRAIAFTLSFEYEDPQVAAQVANEFLTLILAEDARTRSSQATETTRFLEGEVKRLQTELSTTENKLADLRRQPRDSELDTPDQVKDQNRILAELKADLAQKESIYSNAHPAVQALRNKVAALEKVVARESSAASKAAKGSVDSQIEAVERQVASIDKSLEEANRKLTLARQGERLEMDQQAERLRVIEKPMVPQRPVRPHRMKLLAMTLAFAGMAGVGVVLAAEALDKSIRGAQELTGIIDSQLIVTIPYIETKAEALRIRVRRRALVAGLAATGLAGIVAVAWVGPRFDVPSLINRTWIEVTTRLSK